MDEWSFPSFRTFDAIRHFLSACTRTLTADFVLLRVHCPRLHCCCGCCWWHPGAARCIQVCRWCMRLWLISRATRLQKGASLQIAQQVPEFCCCFVMFSHHIIVCWSTDRVCTVVIVVVCVYRRVDKAERHWIHLGFVSCTRAAGFQGHSVRTHRTFSRLTKHIVLYIMFSFDWFERSGWIGGKRRQLFNRGLPVGFCSFLLRTVLIILQSKYFFHIWNGMGLETVNSKQRPVIPAACWRRCLAVRALELTEK